MAGPRRRRATRRQSVPTSVAHARGSLFCGYHQAMTAHIGYKKTIVATVHKILRIIHALRA